MNIFFCAKLAYLIVHRSKTRTMNHNLGWLVVNNLSHLSCYMGKARGNILFSVHQGSQILNKKMQRHCHCSAALSFKHNSNKRAVWIKESKKINSPHCSKRNENCKGFHTMGLLCGATSRKCWYHIPMSFHKVDKRECSTQTLSTLQGEKDRYGGIWINLRQLNSAMSDCQFDALLKESLSTWREKGLETVWLQADMAQGDFVAVASRYGFSFHHAEGQQATLFLGLDPSKESRVPMFASHQVGVSGVVVNEETKEVLVVQDKGRRFTLWKFPGGLSDLGEDIAKTAQREVFEETGLKTEFQSILAFRQQHEQPGAFGRSDLYILCRLKPLTFELNPCEDEISACQWMSVEELKKEVHASSITHRMAALIDLGLTDGWDKVDILPTEMKSIHKGKIFHMFNRPIS